MQSEVVASHKTRIVILGAGFGGLYAAMRLEKTLARDADIEITLVNRENFILFTPMLHEVATSDIDPTHIVNPIRKLLNRVRFFAGDVEAIDLVGRTVTVSHGAEHHHHELEYDHLVLALGSTTNFFGLPGVERHAITMKSLGDAIHLRNHTIRCMEDADFECCPDQRRPLLTFVVAGGGFAGVETVGGLNDFVRESLRFYPSLTEEMVRVVLVHAGPVLLPELSEKLGRYSAAALGRRGVEVLVNTQVERVSDAGVHLSNGDVVATATFVWAAGSAPNPILASLPCQNERGRVLANEFLEVPEWPGVWALGDCAVIRDPRTGQPYPPTAQHACRQGRVLADNLRAKIRGGIERAFVFSTLGQLAAIGRRTGVANILGWNFSGFIAWFLWRSIYLMKLPRFEKKVRVALDWLLDVCFSKDLVQFTTDRSLGESNGRRDASRHAMEAGAARG